MEGSIPVAANSKEHAEELIHKILHNRKDVKVIDICTPDEIPEEAEEAFDMMAAEKEGLN